MTNPATPPSSGSPKPRKPPSLRNDRAILQAISGIDGKVDAIGERVARIEGQQSSQISGATAREERISCLENKRIDESRVQNLESASKDHETRIGKLERAETKTETLLNQMSTTLTELKDDFKPVKKFVDRGNLFLLGWTATGGVIGAVTTALVLKLLHLT